MRFAILLSSLLLLIRSHGVSPTRAARCKLVLLFRTFLKSLLRETAKNKVLFLVALGFSCHFFLGWGGGIFLKIILELKKVLFS